MVKQRVVSRAQWLEARLDFMAKEKTFTRLRDQLSDVRRRLPWVKMEQDYVFDAENGAITLSDLFEGMSQLVVYHFMFGLDWEEGCPSCSFWADNYNGTQMHLAQRDIKLVAVSRAPLKKLLAYKWRMGWSFDWVSSAANSFNQDFAVSFSGEETSEANYNFGTSVHPGTEAPGFSVFYKDEEGEVFHTYSTFARGLDIFNSAYHIMDMTPKGRDESAFQFPMAWVRRKDQYD